MLGWNSDSPNISKSRKLTESACSHEKMLTLLNSCFNVQRLKLSWITRSKDGRGIIDWAIKEKNGTKHPYCSLLLLHQGFWDPIIHHLMVRLSEATNLIAKEDRAVMLQVWIHSWTSSWMTMFSCFRRNQLSRRRRATWLTLILQRQIQGNKRRMLPIFKFMINTTVTGSTWWIFTCFTTTNFRHGTKNATAAGANKHAGGHNANSAATTHAPNALKATTSAKNAIHFSTGGTPKSKQKPKTTTNCCNKHTTRRMRPSSTKELKSSTIHRR